MKEHVITGIDIGSHYVTTMIAAFSNESPTPQIIGIGRIKSAGVRKGVITDPDDATACIRKSFQEAQKNAGVSVSSAYVGIGGNHVASVSSRGTVAVSRVDGQISIDDIERVISNAATIALPANQEILHNIPSEFIIDGEGGFRDVVGMNGLRLEANTVILRGSSAHIKTLNRCMEDSGISVDGYVLAPLASAKAVLSKRQRELGVVCINIGGGTTELSVFEEGNLIYANILPVGGDNITNDLAIGLRVDVDIAEQIKREYGMARVGELSQKRDIIDLAQFNPNEKDTVLRKDVIEIMEARLNEIFEFINKELQQIDKEAFLPGGAVLVGGSAKIPHIVELCRDKLRLASQIGFPRDVEGIAGSVDDPSFATILGIIFWALEEDGYKEGGMSFGNFPNFSGSIGQLKKWIRNLLP